MLLQLILLHVFLCQNDAARILFTAAVDSGTHIGSMVPLIKRQNDIIGAKFRQIQVGIIRSPNHCAGIGHAGKAAGSWSEHFRPLSASPCGQGYCEGAGGSKVQGGAERANAAHPLRVWQ